MMLLTESARALADKICFKAQVYALIALLKLYKII